MGIDFEDIGGDMADIDFMKEEYYYKTGELWEEREYEEDDFDFGDDWW